MRLYELFNEMASAGASGAGGFATGPVGGTGSKPRSQVGSLFGGTYKQPKPKKKSSGKSK